MSHFGKTRIAGAMALAAACWMASPARAGYSPYGLGMDVQTGTVNDSCAGRGDCGE